jgi:Ser-tRNA(Ala) deacylase AlaX
MIILVSVLGGQISDTRRTVDFELRQISIEQAKTSSLLEKQIKSLNEMVEVIKTSDENLLKEQRKRWGR